MLLEHRASASVRDAKADVSHALHVSNTILLLGMGWSLVQVAFAVQLGRSTWWAIAWIVLASALAASRWWLCTEARLVAGQLVAVLLFCLHGLELRLAATAARAGRVGDDRRRMEVVEAPRAQGAREMTSAQRWPERLTSLGLTRQSTPVWIQDVLMGEQNTVLAGVLRLDRVSGMVQSPSTGSTPDFALFESILPR